MHTARNIFKKENFNLKNTETVFYFFKQFRYLSLHIGGNGDSVEVFCLFSMYLNDKAFKYLKTQSFSWKFQVTFLMYLDIGRDNDDDYGDGESSDKGYYEQYDDEKHALIR